MRVPAVVTAAAAENAKANAAEVVPVAAEGPVRLVDMDALDPAEMFVPAAATQLALLVVGQIAHPAVALVVAEDAQEVAPGAAVLVVLDVTDAPAAVLAAAGTVTLLVQMHVPLLARQHQAQAADLPAVEAVKAAADLPAAGIVKANAKTAAAVPVMRPVTEPAQINVTELQLRRFK